MKAQLGYFFTQCTYGGRLVLLGIMLLMANEVWAQRMPAANEWKQEGIAPPGNSYPVGSVEKAEATSVPNVPEIAAWNINVVLPGESFSLTGDKFTLRSGQAVGSDVTVWLYSAAGLVKCPVYSVTSREITASVPSQLPFDVYMVWVENEAGISKPCALNKPNSIWIGPKGNRAYPGEAKRIFGKNLSAQHGTSQSYVYLVPAGGGAATPAAVTRVEPYAVGFTVPASMPNGTYNVYVHSGHGGSYGFSEPAELVIETVWQRSAQQVSLAPSGGDDAARIQQAINSMAANAQGGTVNLQEGVYNLKSQPLEMRSGVMLTGAGMDKTELRIALNLKPDGSVYGAGIYFYGSNVTFRDLTVNYAKPSTQYGPTKEKEDGNITNCNWINVRFKDEPFPANQQSGMIFVTNRGEITGCEFNLSLYLGQGSAWVHDNVFNGGRYYQTEGCLGGGGLGFVLENNLFQTKNWPVGPNGSRNYLDFVPQSELLTSLRAKRMYIASNYPNVYVAHNTCKDCAVQDNKGEIILLHELESRFYAEVASATTNTVTISSSGSIAGVTTRIDEVGPGTSIPNEVKYKYVDDCYAIIIEGKGKGQVRKISSHTASTLTLQRPWRVLPDASSRLVIAPMYENHIFYQNELNGFPEGYQMTSTAASIGIQMSGNAFGCVAEGNVSRRTYTGRMIGGYTTAPSLWSEMRNEKAYDTYQGGISILPWIWSDATWQIIGSLLTGNKIVGCDVTVQTPAQQNNGNGTLALYAFHRTALGVTYLSDKLAVGNIIEKNTGSGAQIGLEAIDHSGVLFRQNTLTLADAPKISGGPLGVRLDVPSSALFLTNTLTNAAVGFNSPLSRLLPLAPRLQYDFGDASQPLKQFLPLANGGGQPLTVSVSSGADWIKTNLTTLSLNPQQQAEQLLEIEIDTSRIDPYVAHDGLITLTGNGETRKVGIFMTPFKPVSTSPALRQPENPANAISGGLDYRYYEGNWTTLPDFSTLTPVTSGTTAFPTVIVRGRDDLFGLQFSGYLQVAVDGIYTFYTNSDDGSQLYIGSTLVVNNNGLHGPQEKAGTIGLKAGKHAITVNYFERTGGQTIDVSYQGPSLAKIKIPGSSFFRINPSAPAGRINAEVVEASQLEVSPNPFEQEVVIRYRLSEAQPVNVELFDRAGRRVALLQQGQQSAGTHEVRYEGYKLATGYYLVRLKTRTGIQTRRILKR